MALVRGADNLVRYKGPTNGASGVVLDSDAVTAGSGSVKLRVFDEEKDMRTEAFTTRTVSDAVKGATSLRIPVFTNAAGVFDNTDDIEIIYPNGDTAERAISAPSTVTGYTTISFTGGVDMALAAGTIVRLVRTQGDLITINPLNRVPQKGDALELTKDDLVFKLGLTVDATPIAIAEEDADNVLAVPSENHPSNQLVELSAAITAPGCSIGSRIRVKLGADITMTQYGTAVSGKDDWGWQAIVPDILALPQNGIVRLEVHFDAGVDLKGVSSWVEPVVEYER